MIQKLRKKFILTNMLLVLLVLLIVFAALMLTSLKSAYSESLLELDRALLSRVDEPQTTPEIGKKFRDRLPTSGYYTVLLDENGAVASSSFSNVTVSDETLQATVAEVTMRSSTTGFLADYQLLYRGRLTKNGLKIAFLDVSQRCASLRRLLLVSLAVGFIALCAFFCISLFLSGWALRPVENAWRQQKQFVADASHELKTPLTVILANTGIVLSHPDATVKREAQWLESTRDEGLHMKRLVDDMLFLAKSDDAAVGEPLSPVALSDVVQKTVLSFEPVAFEKDVALTAEIAPDLLVLGSESQLLQLVGVLLDNAVKYAGEQGQVDVSLLRERETVRLTVRNTGAVIPAADLPHVFERFYRADKSRARREGGFGLGLAIAKRIADTHSARLTATSDDRAGTVFTLEMKGAQR